MLNFLFFFVKMTNITIIIEENEIIIASIPLYDKSNLRNIILDSAGFYQ